MGIKFIAAALALLGATAPAASAEPKAPLKLWRLDCGSLVEPPPTPWRKAEMPVGCYLVQHGSRYLLWDAGVSARALGNAHPTIKLKRTISDQLKDLGLRPDQIEMVAISHYHGDHTGQATQFPKARLIIGAEDLQALRQREPPGGSAPTHVKPWLDGAAPVSALREDLDAFGDGRVVVLRTPGHTPGHLSLLVKLASRPVLLSGDLWHSHANVVRDEIPAFNTSHADTAASRERVRRLVREQDAVVILQHDDKDIADLPAFPQAAE